MRKILFVLMMASGGATLLSACHDDLVVIQKGAIDANSMWVEEGDAEAAMYGMYSRFRSAFATNYFFWGEFRNGMWGRGIVESYGPIFRNQLNSGINGTDWAELYTTINDCNLILKHTPGIEFSNESNKGKVIANAYFVRAFCYYWIGRIWGDAPLLLAGFESDNQENMYPTRQAAADIFIQVGKDIDAALDNMPEQSQDRNLASKAAINMLKADYCLWMAKVRGGGIDFLQSAKSAVSAVVSDPKYMLLGDYSSVFESKLNQEIIFAWSYVRDEFTGGYPIDFLVPLQYVTTQYIDNPVKVGSHQQWCFYTEEYKELISAVAGDQRIPISFETFFDAPKNTTFQWINKFSGSWENGTRIFDSDIIAYRYADAILLDAEIENELGNAAIAVESLNKLASRAYGVENYYSSTLSPEAINELILEERMKEFTAEGKTWWDLIRFGKVFEKVPSLVGRQNEENILLWPVSSSSINRNPNIKQTPGYL